jgi:adenosylhomocysteine nucleosidase
METFGILAAMSQESDALLRLIAKRSRSNFGPYHCYHFQLSERNCWLLTSGMGVRRAAEATRMLIEAANPQLLVSVGIAGAVNADLEIGDVVASTNNCVLDKEGRPGPFQPLARLSKVARQAVEQALQPEGVRLFEGIAITTHGAQFIQPQPGQLANPVLEMETAGIMSVAAEKSLPVLSLRAISDGPRAPIPFNLEQMMDEHDNLRTAAIIRTILGHPKIFPQLVRMGRNSRLAADNAALALFSALSQSGPVIIP